MHIIIGAGPTGLYTALSLAKAGVDIKNIVIYDPRANDYTRPGELLRKAFRNTESRLNLKFDEGIFQKRVPDRAARLAGSRTVEYAHISDFEKTLYQQALNLGISIEKKRFVLLQDDERATGVIVEEADGRQAFIPADYVFDCTGPYRHVVNAVNQVCPEQPFKLQVVTSAPINTHFLAYVKMQKNEFKTLKDNLEFADDTTFARNLFALQKLGWNEFKFPNCWGGSFGEEKACLYIERPAQLAKENDTAWFEAVLALYGPSITYQRLPESKEHPSKTTFTAFTLKAHALEKMSHTINKLTVIALGDAQIDANYELAHGIYNGIDRTDAMLSAMTIANGKINFFNENDYMNAIQPFLSKHKGELRRYAIDSRQSILAAEKNAKARFHRLICNGNTPEKNIFEKMLNNLEARLNLTCLHLMKFSLFGNSFSNTLLPKDTNLVIAQLLIELIIKEINEQKSEVISICKFAPNSSY